jgi:hypothetical protein
VTAGAISVTAMAQQRDPKSTNLSAVWTFAASFWIEVSPAFVGTLRSLAHGSVWFSSDAEVMNSQRLLKRVCVDAVQELGIWFQQTSLPEVRDVFS